ncbi:MAG: Yip1 family protein [Candidatus Margulisiibacteriota bacterium]|nr:Yip1 family protein [Candidatus Margulisiibacteriota bacterium]
MKIIERIKEIIMKPKAAWKVIKDEPSDIKALYLNYAAPLALIPAVCSLIGMTIVGIRMPAGEVMRSPFVPTLIGSAIGYGLSLLGLIIGAWIVKLLAPTFNSKADLADAFKVVVYSMTPVWLVGIFSLVPGLGILGILGLYAIYLLALGFPVVLNTPENKVVWFTISIILVSMVVNFILSAIVFGALYGPMYMQMMAV